MNIEKSIKRKERHWPNTSVTVAHGRVRQCRPAMKVVYVHLLLQFTELTESSWASLIKYRCGRRQSCPVGRRNLAKALRLVQFGILWSVLHYILLEFILENGFRTKFFTFFLVRSLMLSKGISISWCLKDRSTLLSKVVFQNLHSLWLGQSTCIPLQYAQRLSWRHYKNGQSCRSFSRKSITRVHCEQVDLYCTPFNLI